VVSVTIFTTVDVMTSAHLLGQFCRC